jgi:protein gp37
MSKDTPIEWCDSTVNPVMGCDGCELWDNTVKSCYAGQLHEMRGGQKGYAPTFKEVTMFPGRMAATLKWKDLTGTDRPDKPWLNRMPRLIFVSDMSDALSHTVSFDYLKQEIIDVVKGSPHQYLWLTKRPKRMADFADWLGGWPKNLWAGTSVTDQKTADQRVPQLLQVPALVRFLSVEPMLEKIDLKLTKPVPVIDDKYGDQHEYVEVNRGIRLVIVGGESGDESRPCQVEWIRDVIMQGQETQAKVFIKQLGKIPISWGCTKPGQHWPVSDIRPAMSEFEFGGNVLWRHHLHSKKGGDITEWPKDLRIREFPNLK